MASAAGLKPPKPIVLGDNMAAQWKNWVRQYSWFATATQLSEKSDEVQAATFMSAIGEDCVRIYDTFGLRPEEENDVDVIKAKFDEYFTPKSCITFERYNFNQIVQREDEQFDSFVTRVKEQAKKCSFSVLNDSLVKDRIIIGVKYTSLVPQLLNDDLTLQKTIELCRNFELTTIQTKALAGEAKVDAVNSSMKKHISGRYEEREVFQCKKCGRKHMKRSCPAFGKHVENVECQTISPLCVNPRMSYTPLEYQRRMKRSPMMTQKNCSLVQWKAQEMRVTGLR